MVEAQRVESQVSNPSGSAASSGGLVSTSEMQAHKFTQVASRVAEAILPAAAELLRGFNDTLLRPNLPNTGSDQGAHQMPAPIRLPSGGEVTGKTKPTNGDGGGAEGPAKRDRDSDVKTKLANTEPTVCYEIGAALAGMIARRPAPETGGKVEKGKQLEGVQEKAITPEGLKVEKFNEALDQLPDGGLKDFMRAGFDLARSGKVNQAQLVSMAQQAMNEFGKIGSQAKDQIAELNAQLKRDFGFQINISADSAEITNRDVAYDFTALSVSKNGYVSAYLASGRPITKIQTLTPAQAAEQLQIASGQVAEGRAQFKAPAGRMNINPTEQKTWKTAPDKYEQALEEAMRQGRPIVVQIGERR